MKLSKLLKTCINNNLAESAEDARWGRREFSCHAIQRSIDPWNSESYYKIQRFLCALGLEMSGSGFYYLRNEDTLDEFREEPKYDLQFTRALWLTFVIEYLKDNPEEDFEV